MEFAPFSATSTKFIITCLEVIHLRNHLLLFLLSPCFCILISTVDFQISINQRGWERCQIQVLRCLIRQYRKDQLMIPLHRIIFQNLSII